MSNHPPRSRISTCLLLIILVICVFVVSVILVPSLITSQAEKTYGASSPNLSTVDRLYLSLVILLQTDSLTQPVDVNGTEVTLTINQGENIPSIIGKLSEAGLISNATAFSSLLEYSGMDTTLKAGEYVLSPALTPIEIAQKMQVSISPFITLTILPGWRSEEIATSLPLSGFNISPDDFISAINNPPAGYSFSGCLGANSLEGFLFPGSYTLPRESTLNDLLPQILMNFESQVTPDIREGFSLQGLDLCQAITLASIVQREAVLEEEMPMIASVFYNRLNSGNALESDPTVQYAVGFNESQDTWWTNPLSAENLRVDSPYNTYRYPGLTPGPISNPGLTAIQAIAFPAQSSFFYFRSACDGSGRHLFANTFDEHLANACP